MSGVLNPSHGPLGKKRWPGTPILLGFVTLGIYTLVWYWKTSKEVDAFMVRPGHSHSRIKKGLLFYLLGLLTFVIAIGAMVAAVLPVADETGTLDQPPQELVAGSIVAVIGFILGLGLFITGFVLLTMGMWRVWKQMEEEDQRRLASEPFNATTALVLFLLQLIPYVGFIIYIIAIVLTQRGLNRIWAAYSGAAPAPAA